LREHPNNWLFNANFEEMDIFDEIGHSFEAALETGYLRELLLDSSQSRNWFVWLLISYFSDFERIINVLKIVVELSNMLDFEMIEIADVVFGESIWDRVRCGLVHHWVVVIKYQL
jgi:hypothetical protein